MFTKFDRLIYLTCSIWNPHLLRVQVTGYAFTCVILKYKSCKMNGRDALLRGGSLDLINKVDLMSPSQSEVHMLKLINPGPKFQSKSEPKVQAKVKNQIPKQNSKSKIQNQ